MKVENEIQIYEVNGYEIKTPPVPYLKIASHGIRDAFVVIEIDGQRYTVIASQLEKAIRNATNWR
jgi:hypothetical protein